MGQSVVLRQGLKVSRAALPIVQKLLHAQHIGLMEVNQRFQLLGSGGQTSLVKIIKTVNVKGHQLDLGHTFHRLLSKMKTNQAQKMVPADENHTYRKQGTPLPLKAPIHDK